MVGKERAAAEPRTISTKALGAAVAAVVIGAPMVAPGVAAGHVGPSYQHGDRAASDRAWTEWVDMADSLNVSNSAQNLSGKTACVQAEYTSSAISHNPHHFGAFRCRGAGQAIVSHPNNSDYAANRDLCWNGLSAGGTLLGCWWNPYIGI
jgi:hypothetical protein